jgi:hypothetical protein
VADYTVHKTLATGMTRTQVHYPPAAKVEPLQNDQLNLGFKPVTPLFQRAFAYTRTPLTFISESIRIHPNSLDLFFFFGQSFSLYVSALAYIRRVMAMTT